VFFGWFAGLSLQSWGPNKRPRVLSFYQRVA